MAKTSPELLTDILGVLGQMSAKMDATNSQTPAPKKETNVSFGAAGVIGTLLGKKGVAAKMAEDVEKLKTAMKGFNLVRLNQMIDSLKKYNEASKEGATSKKTSGWAIAAQDMGKALVYIAGGIGLFAGVLAASGGLLGVSPIGVLGFIMGSMIALSMAMIIISGGDAEAEKIAGFLGGKSKFKNAKPDEGRNKKAIQNAKDMGIALMFIAGGIMAFGVVLGLAAAVFGVSGALLVPVAIIGVIALLGLAMLGLAELTAIGDKAGTGKNKGKSKDAIQNAKDMGLALMFIAGGVLAFAIVMAVVPVIFKKTSVLAAIGEIALIIVGMAGLIALLGFAQRLIQPGIEVAKGIGIALLILSAGVFVVALTSKILLEMFRGNKTDDKGNKTKGGPGAALLNAGAALGIFGIFVGGLGALLWVMGLPVVSGPILLGSFALIGMAFSLILTAKAIKSVTDVMKTMDVKTIRTNVGDMISGVMGGVIDGVMGSGLHKNAEGNASTTGNLTIRELMQFRRITKVIRMLGSISKTISQFAMGLRAFAKLGEISSLRYEEGALDKDGHPTMKPIIAAEGTIHVTEIAKAIADTFGIFIKSLVENTQNLTRRQARSLKILGKSLTGDQGLISGVSQFANVLQVFAKFGAKGSIWVPPQYEDEKRTKIVKGTGEAVPITTIVTNIVESFGKFVTAMVAHSKDFEIGGAIANKMQIFTEALMGKKRSGIGSWFASDKPGILSGITGFNDILLLYADYGADGKIPKKGADGNIIPGQSINVTDVAKNIVSGITLFTNALSIALNGQDIAKSANEIDAKMGSFKNIITQFDELAQSQEGLDKMANSLGLLATNMGLLVTNMGPLNTDKLQSLATITAQHAVTTKGVAITPQSSTSATSSATSAEGQADWDKIADRMGDIIAQKLSGGRNGEFNFTFYDGNSGGKLEIKENK